MRRRRVRVFVSYAHANRDVVELLLDHLGVLTNDERIEIFDDRQLVGGEDWDARLREELARADLVLFVVTAKFLRSSYCAQVELKETIRRREAEGIVVMPIIAEHCLWTALPLARLQALPKDANLQLKPLNKWDTDTDVALTQIAQQVQINVDRLAAVSVADEDQRRHGSQTPPPRGWRQPVQPDRCLGRADGLAVLVAALTAQPPRPIVVFGGAGMGKSTLTREAAAAPAVLALYGDRRAWVELDKATEQAAVLAALADALGLPAERDPWHGIEAVLGQAPALLVLDNLETPWENHPTDIEDLLARLARLPGVALAASIRGGAVPSRPVWGTRREIHRLAWPHDRDLLLGIAADVPGDDPLLPDVLRALDGWPLAIELFAAQADGLADLTLTWRRWQAERTAMLDRGEATPDRLSSLAVSLGFSLNSPRLKLKPPHPPDAALRLFAMLGRLPDGLALDDADALLPGSGSAAAQCLVQRRLGYQDAGRIRMLAPVREHAGRIALTPADLGALYDHYLGFAAELRRYFNGDYRGIEVARLRSELVNIDALIAQAPDATVTGDRDAAFRRELGSLSIAIGAARREQGQLALALASYAQAEHVFSDLTLDDPGNAQWQRDLSISWSRLGEVRSAQGDLTGALQAFSADMEITAKLAAADPGNAQWQRDLSVSWNRLGEVRSAQDDLTGALQAFTADMEITAKLAVADPGNAQWQRDLIVSHWKLADLLERIPGRSAEAAGHWSQALAIARALAATGRLAPADAYFVATLEERLAAAPAGAIPPP